MATVQENEDEHAKRQATWLRNAQKAEVEGDNLQDAFRVYLLPCPKNPYDRMQEVAYPKKVRHPLTYQGRAYWEGTFSVTVEAGPN